MNTGGGGGVNVSLRYYTGRGYRHEYKTSADVNYFTGSKICMYIGYI